MVEVVSTWGNRKAVSGGMGTDDRTLNGFWSGHQVIYYFSEHSWLEILLLCLASNMTALGRVTARELEAWFMHWGHLSSVAFHGGSSHIFGISIYPVSDMYSRYQYFLVGNRLYLRACFPTARSPTARLVRQLLWRDVTFLGLQCWNTQSSGVLRTD